MICTRRRFKILKNKITLKPVSWSKKNKETFANNVTWEIIGRKEFIENTASIDPYFYSSFIGYLKNDKLRYSPSGLVSTFFRTLVTGKDYWLLKELRRTEGHGGLFKVEEIPKENRILFALFRDLDFIESNSIWQPFGDSAKDELWSEGIKGERSFLAQIYSDEEILWNSIVKNSILFFDLLIRAAISQKRTYHMWLHYYYSFTDIIARNVENICVHYGDFDPTETYYAQLLDEMFFNMKHWIECINDENYPHLYQDITLCYGRCLIKLCNSPGFHDDYKVSKINILLELYNDFVDQTITPDIRDEIDKILIQPRTYNQGERESYHHYLDLAFHKLDYPKFQINGKDDTIGLQRLRVNIIDKLGFSVSY